MIFNDIIFPTDVGYKFLCNKIAELARPVKK